MKTNIHIWIQHAQTTLFLFVSIFVFWKHLWMSFSSKVIYGLSGALFWNFKRQLSWDFVEFNSHKIFQLKCNQSHLSDVTLIIWAALLYCNSIRIHPESSTLASRIFISKNTFSFQNGCASVEWMSCFPASNKRFMLIAKEKVPAKENKMLRYYKVQINYSSCPKRCW